MSAVRSGSAPQALVLTPEWIRSFFIPSRSPRLLLVPRSLCRLSPDQTALVSDPEDDSPESSPVSQSPHRSPRLPLRLPHIELPCAATDTEVTTRAAMSLTHVEKLTPYSFHTTQVESPCTRPQESLFHQSKLQTIQPPPTGHWHCCRVTAHTASYSTCCRNLLYSKHQAVIALVFLK